jgi:hypothetical protein
MLHLLYLVAFTVIAFLAIGNLLRSLMTVSMDAQRRYSHPGRGPADWGQSPHMASRSRYKTLACHALHVCRRRPRAVRCHIQVFTREPD